MITPHEVFKALKNRIECYYADFCGEVLWNDSPLWEFHEYMQEHYPDEEYEVESGASKAVIVFDDFVIKIPFGCMYDEDHYNEDTDEYGDYIPLEHNYCKREAEIYQLAEKSGLDFCFAETTLLGKFNGYCIYMQPTVKSFYSKNSSHSREERENIESKYGRQLGKLDNNWVIDFITAFGETAFQLFLDFCEENSINDLHGSNIGYYYGVPMVFDFSGYWD